MLLGAARFEQCWVAFRAVMLLELNPVACCSLTGKCAPYPLSLLFQYYLFMFF